MSRSATRTFDVKITLPLEVMNSLSVHVATDLRQTR